MHELDAFLSDNALAEASRSPVAGDASARRYLRLHPVSGPSVIVMIAPPQMRASTEAFCRIAAFLREVGLAAPVIHDANPARGLVLMSDLGRRSLSDLLASDPAAVQGAYMCVARQLAGLARVAPPPDLALDAPDHDALAAMIDVTLARVPSPPADLLPALADTLEGCWPLGVCVALRDVHGDNLIWRPEEPVPSRIGWLDFQDALILPIGYDLASLVDDVRRDVPLALRGDLIAAFAAAIGVAPEAMQAQIGVLSVQRNLRILGVFHRLAHEQGKPQYLTHLPRIRGLISRAVEASPAMAALRAPVDDVLRQTLVWNAAP